MIVGGVVISQFLVVRVNLVELLTLYFQVPGVAVKAELKGTSTLLYW